MTKKHLLFEKYRHFNLFYPGTRTRSGEWADWWGIAETQSASEAEAEWVLGKRRSDGTWRHSFDAAEPPSSD